MLVVLGEQGIKELDDFAELAADELTSPEDGILREFDLDEEAASEMIMAARAHWFDDDEHEKANLNKTENDEPVIEQ